MKRLIPFVLMFCATQVLAQTDITVEIDQLLNGEAIEFNKAAKNNIDNDFKINRLEYYVSGISIRHDGGQELELSDMYFLIDPSKHSQFGLGSHDVTNIESIKFHIGVDRDKNHADPSQYSSDHALAPKSPSMHWGWSAGYRFVAMEGKAGASMNTTFELHALGDDYYFPIEIPFTESAKDGAINIKLRAEYSKLLESINVSQGLIVHGAYGEAVELLENFRDHVFTNILGEGNVLLSPDVDLITGMYPNPSTGIFNVLFDKHVNGTVEVLDINGKVAAAFNVNGKLITLNTDLKSGIYFIRIKNENGVIARRKWIVARS